MRENSLPWGKDTFYRFLSESRINWRRFLLVLAKRLLHTFFLPLTMERRDRVLVLDDSAYSRNRRKRWHSCRSATTTATIATSGDFGCFPSAGPTEDPFCLWPSPFSARQRRRIGFSEPRTPTEGPQGHGDGKKR